MNKSPQSIAIAMMIFLLNLSMAEVRIFQIHRSAHECP
jgi:hypothetical protein